MATLTDFLACALHLIDLRYTCSPRLFLEGHSAGGELRSRESEPHSLYSLCLHATAFRLTGVCNGKHASLIVSRRHCRVSDVADHFDYTSQLRLIGSSNCLCSVPFVDVLTTMADDSIPFTIAGTRSQCPLHVNGINELSFEFVLQRERNGETRETNSNTNTSHAILRTTMLS